MGEVGFPIKYLCLPLTYNKLKHSECGAFLASLKKTLTKQSGRGPSYAGKCQLLNSNFQGKDGYWMQGARLPKRILRHIRSIKYKFLWDSRKGAAWDTITMEKGEGGLGIKDFQVLDEVAAIKEAFQLWEEGSNDAWSSCMHARCVKSRELDAIVKKSANSSNWKSLMATRGKIRGCAKLGG